jgi:two-component system chemotaxis response regulator CheY
MDIVMPQMDGITALREIIRFDPDAKVVMCSALGQEALIAESIEAGARDFIVKPFQPSRVLKVVQSVLGLDDRLHPVAVSGPSGDAR